MYNNIKNKKKEKTGEKISRKPEEEEDKNDSHANEYSFSPMIKLFFLNIFLVVGDESMRFF